MVMRSKSLNIDNTDWTGLNRPQRTLEFEKYIRLDAQSPRFKFSMGIQCFTSRPASKKLVLITSIFLSSRCHQSLDFIITIS